MLAPESIGAGYWYANLTVAKDFGSKYTLGVRVSNLTNNQHGSTPCSSDGTGCGGFNGGGSGYTGPVGYVNQPITQDPRRYELFMNVKI